MVFVETIKMSSVEFKTEIHSTPSRFKLVDTNAISKMKFPFAWSLNVHRKSLMELEFNYVVIACQNKGSLWSM